MHPDAPSSTGLPMIVDSVAHRHERRIEFLIDRLPSWLRPLVRWLRRPSSRLVRIPAGVLLICGGILSLLPIFGLWMFPLGLVLLAEDIPPIRRARDYLLDWIAQRRPHWLGEASR
jgi:hypothetical protein